MSFQTLNIKKQQQQQQQLSIIDLLLTVLFTFKMPLYGGVNNNATGCIWPPGRSLPLIVIRFVGLYC